MCLSPKQWKAQTDRISDPSLGQLLTERIHDVGRHRSPTLLYMPRLEELDVAFKQRVGIGLEKVLNMLPRWAPLLVVLTSAGPYTGLEEQQRAALATDYRHEVQRPGPEQRSAFFATLLSDGARGGGGGGSIVGSDGHVTRRGWISRTDLGIFGDSGKTAVSGLQDVFFSSLR